MGGYGGASKNMEIRLPVVTRLHCALYMLLPIQSSRSNEYAMLSILYNTNASRYVTSMSIVYDQEM